jgi:outer membrane receptor protein involved in Fe transport
LSGNLFYYDISNAQRGQAIVILAPTGAPVTFADLFNVPKAWSKGAEATIEWRPIPALSTRLAMGFLRTKITRAEAAYGQFEGKEFQRAPRFTASASVDWSPVDRLALSAQVRHNSGYFSDDLNDERRRVSGWTKIDARAAYDFKRFQAFGYVRNLLDDFYLTYLFNSTFATAGDPREFGIGLEARF